MLRAWLLICFLFSYTVALAQTTDGLEQLADRVALAEQPGVSAVELDRLEPALRSVVEAGLLNLGAPQKITIETQTPDYSDVRFQDMLIEAQRVLGTYQYMNIDLSIRHQQEQNLTQLTGRLERFYDVFMGTPKAQQFREKFSIVEPKLLNGFVFLTIRPLDAQLPDFTWHYSPLGEVFQELDQSLRDDGLFDVGVGLNDLLGLSARADLFELQAEEVVSAFVPIIIKNSDDRMEAVRKVSGCEEFSQQQSAGLLAQRASAVRRKLIKLNLLVADPFSRIGRRVLFLDMQTLAPVFLENYDRSDLLLLSQVNVLALAEIKGQNRLLPVASVSVHQKNKAKTKITYDHYVFCDQSSAFTPANEFDPVRLIPPHLKPKASE